MLFWLITVVALGTFMLGDPRSLWLLGGLLICGALTPAILKTHEHTHPFFVDKLWPRFWLCSIPVCAALLQLALGHLQPALHNFTVDQAPFIKLDSVAAWRPTTASSSGSWLTVFGFSAAYLIALQIFLIPKSRAFFERMLPWLCAGAVGIALLGYLQEGLNLSSPILTRGTGSPDFFAFFPYDGHWAAFATLWCATCISMALLSTRYEDSPRFVKSSGPWYLAGGSILGATGFLVVAPIPATVLLLTFSVMLLIVSFEFMARSKDPHRKLITVACGLAACLSFAAGIFRILQESADGQTAEFLRRAAFDMFKANPFLGWGADSFNQLLPFFANDQLLGKRFLHAGSDFAQLLVEFGMVGALLAIVFLLGFLSRYFFGQHNIQLTNHLLVGCAAVLVLAIWDNPFMSPSVFFSFFLLFFTAMRWADLSRNKIDEVDATRPRLVTPASERRLPFFNQPYKEKER